MKSMIIFTLCISSAIYSCSTSKSATTTITCPKDGRTLNVYKNPNDAYPAWVKDRQSGIKASIDILDKVKIADIEATTKTTATELRNKLNDVSSRFEIIAKSAFLAFNTDPCNSTEYWKIMNSLVELEKMRTGIESTLNSGGMVGNNEDKIKKYIDTFTSKSSL